MKKLLFILSLTLFVACDDDDKVSEYPVVMSFDNIKPLCDTKMYTDGGVMIREEHNKKVFTNFLDRSYTIYSSGSMVSYNSTFRDPRDYNYGDVDLVFYSPDDIVFAADIIDVKRDEDVMILKSSVKNEVKDWSIVTSDFFKYKYDITDKYYNYQYVLRGDSKSIDVSLVSYKLIRYDENGELQSVTVGLDYNEFNKSFVSTLTKFDTLAVREYKMRYLAK